MSLKTPQTHGPRARNRWLHPISKFGSKEHPQIQWSLATGSSWHTFSVLSRPFTILVDRMKHALQYATCSFHVRYWVDCWPLWAGPCAAMKQVEWYCWSHMSITIFPLFIFYHSCSLHMQPDWVMKQASSILIQAASWSLRRPPSVECKRDKSKVLQFLGPKMSSKPRGLECTKYTWLRHLWKHCSIWKLTPSPGEKGRKMPAVQLFCSACSMWSGGPDFLINIHPTTLHPILLKTKSGWALPVFAQKNADLPPFQPNNSPGYKAMNVPR